MLGVEGALKEVIAKFGDYVACAFLYGSVARQQEHALSDVDLMIIGSVGLSELSPSLHMLEKKFGREINVKCYSPVEFREKVEDGNHFVTSVLRDEKTFLKGGEDELESLAGKRDRSAT
jgi:predicted nucleotidyltransferase